MEFPLAPVGSFTGNLALQSLCKIVYIIFVDSYLQDHHKLCTHTDNDAFGAWTKLYGYMIILFEVAEIWSCKVWEIIWKALVKHCPVSPQLLLPSKLTNHIKEIMWLVSHPWLDKHRLRCAQVLTCQGLQITGQSLQPWLIPFHIKWFPSIIFNPFLSIAWGLVVIFTRWMLRIALYMESHRWFFFNIFKTLFTQLISTWEMCL